MKMKALNSTRNCIMGCKLVTCRSSPSIEQSSQPIPTRQNFGPDKTESICRRQIKCYKNDNFCL